MRHPLMLLIVLALPLSVHADEGIKGLLAIPEVYGEGPCDEFSPTDIALYADAGDADAIATIRVERYWEFPPEGGCKGLSVVVEKNEGGSAQPLPSMEYGYELPAALVVDRAVLGQDEHWFEIDLGETSAWLRATEGSRYFPLEELLVNRLNYVAPETGVFLADDPGMEHSGSERMHLEYYSDIRVTGVRWAGDKLWLQVDVLNGSGCGSRDEPVIIDQGWVPAHSASGELNVWFYSRGC